MRRCSGSFMALPPRSVPPFHMPNSHIRLLAAGGVLAIAHSFRLSAQQPSDSGDAPRSIPISRLTSIPRAESGTSAGRIVVRPRAAAPDSGYAAREAGSTDAPPDARTFSELLQARLPGLAVLRSSGAEADGSLVRTRGPVSVEGSQQPMLIIDGLRVANDQAAPGLDGVPVLSRLDDLTPEDIDHIDVLRGPAAAALYGPGAAAGVIVVSTRRGQPGPLRWTVHAADGVTLAPDEFPANYQMTGVSTNGTPVAYCTLVERMQQTCTPTTLLVWNPLEQASPFRTGRASDVNAAIAGGAWGGGAFPSGFRISAGARRNAGVTGDDEQRRYNLQGSATQRFHLPALGTLALDASAAYVRRTAALPSTSLNVGLFNPISAGLFGSATDDANHGYLVDPELLALGSGASVDHFTGRVASRWTPFTWLEASLLAGRDRSAQRERRSQETARSSTDLLQEADSARTFTEITSADASIAASYAPARGLRGRTVAALEYQWRGDSIYNAAWFRSSALPEPSYFISRSWLGTTQRGLWIRQELAWRDRLFLNGGARWDHQQLLRTARTLPEPSVDGAWIVRRAPTGTELRVRGAYGRVASGVDGVLEGSSAPFQVRLRDLQSEYMTERELGLDGALRQIASFEVTLYHEDTRNLPLPLVGPPGYSSPVTPIAEMHTSGVEAMLRGVLLQGSQYHWDASLSLGTVRNRMGVPANYPLLIFGAYPQYGVLADGLPYGGYRGRRYAFADANGDGRLDSTEVHVDSTSYYLGSSLPTIDAALSSRLVLHGNLTIAATAEYQGGRKLNDGNESFFCRADNCRGLEDPAAPLDEQAAAYATQYAGGSVYVEDGSFARLRELSVTWSPRAAWARHVLGGGGAISIIGRNLATWTRYRGLDPEITTGGALRVPRSDFAVRPVTPQLLLSVDLGTEGGR